MIDYPAALELHKAGRWAEAEAAYRALLAASSDMAALHQNLARVLLETGRFAEAMDAIEAALALEPRSAELALLSGRVWVELGDLREAAGWFARALRLDPALHEARCHLGLLALEAGDPEGAADAFRAVLARSPDSAAARHGLARALLDEGDAEGAVREHREAIRLRPRSAALHASLGQTLSNSGDLAGAAASFRAALGLDPNFAPALGGLAATLRGELPDGERAAMERLLEAPGMPPARRSALHFGLGQAYDGRGEYGRAAEHVAKGNAEQRRFHLERDQAYRPEEHRRYIDGLIGAFTREFFARTRGFGSDSRRPVFIVGLPRSGTTLAEQILASHPEVFGAGERRFVPLGFAAIPAILGSEKTPVRCLSEVTEKGLKTVADWHLGKLSALDSERRHVVDKMPENFALLGWIAALFPNAAILHCTRDVRDVAVSCWVTNFSRIRWAGDLVHIAERVREYRRCAAHYRAVLPVPVLEVPYEAMVADQEGTTRRMLDFVGLGWDARCLNFHETERLVKTASVAQVRRPIYGKSVARWKRYEAALAPFLERLESP